MRQRVMPSDQHSFVIRYPSCLQNPAPGEALGKNNGETRAQIQWRALPGGNARDGISLRSVASIAAKTVDCRGSGRRRRIDGKEREECGFLLHFLSGVVGHAHNVELRVPRLREASIVRRRQASGGLLAALLRTRHRLCLQVEAVLLPARARKDQTHSLASVEKQHDASRASKKTQNTDANTDTHPS